MWFSGNYKKQLEENGKYTTDIPWLNNFEDHHVFVYGSFKRGCARHIVLSSNTKNRYFGPAVTATQDYDMLVANPAGFPIVFNNCTEKGRLHKVKGELWMVPTETILRMDNIEANGLVYSRELTSIFVGKQTVYAWMYIGNPGFWRNKDMVNSPKWITSSKEGGELPRRREDYYHFFREDVAARLTKQ